MQFFDVGGGQANKYMDGEWAPYPWDLFALHTGKESPEGLSVVIRSGTQPGDMIFATDCVISPRFHELLAELNATGFSVFPAPLIKNGTVVAVYHGLIVHGRGGAFDPVRSDAEYGPSGYLSGYAGVYMHEADWDGSDVFFIPGKGITLFVTTRVADAIRKAKLRNVKLLENSLCRSGSKMDYSKYHYATWLKNKAAKYGDVARPSRKRSKKASDTDAG